MENTLTAVYVANAFGVVLICMLLISNFGRLREKNSESKQLLLLILCTFLGCLTDPLVCTADGQPGELNRAIVLIGNSLLYLVDMCGTFLWLAFLLSHLKVKLSLSHRYILHSALMLGGAIILVNFFLPIIFEIQDNNTYVRRTGYWLYCFIDYGFMLDSLVMYMICRYKGGSMKSIPIGIYLAPLLIGTIAQSFFYGISVISASFTVAIAGLMAGLQGERIYKDKLTGLYSYVYLEKLNFDISQSKKNTMAGIMINLNGFKKLNKDIGRVTANFALRDAANIIARGIGELGTVVRLTSDEFVAFVNTQDEMAINMRIASVKTGFSEFNRDPKNSYKISACFCSANLEPGQNLNDFLEILSKRMHEEKLEFYSQGENNRRRTDTPVQPPQVQII